MTTFRPKSKPLLAHHRAELRRSGLTDETIRKAEIYSERDPSKLAEILGWTAYPSECAPALVYPYKDAQGRNGYARIKPDHPRQSSIKYESPKGQPNQIYLPPNVADVLVNPSKPLMITEGEKKSLCASQYDFPCIGLVGVYGWKLKGRETFLPALKQIVWKGRTVYIAFDSDIATNPNVQKAEKRLAALLKKSGAIVHACRIPEGPAGVDGKPKKQGLDDYMVAQVAKGLDPKKVISKLHKPHPTPKPKKSLSPKKIADSSKSRPSRDRRVRQDFTGYTGGVVEAVENFLKTYIVLSESEILVVASWILAAWLADNWDRFPHLAITSPEKRCGKTRLLQLIQMLVHDGYNTTNISPAAVYRLIELKHPTLLLDEAQSISRRGCESSEVIRELLNAGIDRGAKVLRVGGEGRDQVQEFGVYSPKVIALIGDLDGVLADRCLPVCMERKTSADKVEAFRSRIVEPIGKALHKKIEKWATAHAEEVANIYDALDVFTIENDRLAELLLPLQAILKVACPKRLEQLAEYAESLDKKDKETESPGVRLLIACREIFEEIKKSKKNGTQFLATCNLIARLDKRPEEPWAHYTRGGLITPEAIANLLRPFNIHSKRNKEQTARGYFAHDFQEAWARYLP